MRLKKSILVGALLIGLTPLAQGQITATHHDFSASGSSGFGVTYNPANEKCNVCHAPHFTDTAANPLWIHRTTSTSFTTYTGYNFLQRGGLTISQPDGASKLCLSCHDGITAMNDYGGVVVGTPNKLMPSGSNLTANLSNTHPISFVYDAALLVKDPSLKDPTTTTTPLGHTVKYDMLDANNKVQCTSCHEVHQDNSQDPFKWRFLKVANTGSAMCLLCHNK